MRRCHAISVGALVLGFYACGYAHARELSPSDLQFIEHINQSRNTSVGRQNPRANCADYAVNKLFDLEKAGFGADELSLDEVHVPGHPATETHAVVTVHGVFKGQPIEVVLDSLNSWTETKRTLQDVGYVWITRFPR